MIGENLLGPEPTRLAEDPGAASLSRGVAVEAVVREHPESPLAWALLADEADAEGREVEAYAFARVGYHRGLDALRGAGWRGAGPVPWSHEPNRGFLTCLALLALAARAIGEDDEWERCSTFLRETSAEAYDELLAED